MDKKSGIGIAALCLGVALLVAAVSAAGVFLRGDGATETVVSPRGERYAMVTGGIYRYNAERVVAEGVGWDIVTLFLAVPALLAALPFLARGSLRARLFALGLLAYFFYQYLEYSVFWAFGPLFLPYVVIYPASLAAIAWIVTTIPVDGLPARFSPRFPRRGMAALSFVTAAVLTAMWLARIASALGGGIEGTLLGAQTLVVQSLDLGLIVPLAVLTGVTALRGRPVGYLLCTVFVVKAVTMALAIVAMLVVAAGVEGAVEWPPLLFFGAVAAAAAWLGLRMYRSLQPVARG